MTHQEQADDTVAKAALLTDIAGTDKAKAITLINCIIDIHQRSGMQRLKTDAEAAKVIIQALP